MTEPDEARIAWNACAAARYDDEENGNPLGLPQGMPNFEDFRDGYRAGAAASTERIKALEGAVRSLIGIIDSNGLMHDPVYPPLGFSKRHDGQPVADGVKQARRAVNEARALLKEPDQ